MPLNKVSWLFDIPTQLKGVEHKEIVQEMVQKTVNNIGGKYGTLRNWSVTADPGQVYVSCDAPPDINGAVVVSFGNNMWSQCCSIYLKQRG
jgi:hypothetical protein